MNTLRTRRAVLLASLFVLLAISLRGSALLTSHTARLAVGSPPVIDLELADPASFSKLLPLGSIVKPGAPGTRFANKVVFRAKLTDSDGDIVVARITAKGSMGSLMVSPSPSGFVGVGVDTTRINTGAVISVFVACQDAAGNIVTASASPTLQK